MIKLPRKIKKELSKLYISFDVKLSNEHGFPQPRIILSIKTGVRHNKWTRRALNAATKEIYILRFIFDKTEVTFKTLLNYHVPVPADLLGWMREYLGYSMNSSMDVILFTPSKTDMKIYEISKITDVCLMSNGALSIGYEMREKQIPRVVSYSISMP